MSDATEELADLIGRMVDERIEHRFKTEKEIGLSVNEAAAALSLSSSSMWRAIRRGDVRVERVLGRVLVPKSEVDRVLAGKPTPGA